MTITSIQYLPACMPACQVSWSKIFRNRQRRAQVEGRPNTGKPRWLVRIRSIVLLRIVINLCSLPTKRRGGSYQIAAACLLFLIHLRMKLRPLHSICACVSPNSCAIPILPSPLHTHFPHKRVQSPVPTEGLSMSCHEKCHIQSQRRPQRGRPGWMKLHGSSREVEKKEIRVVSFVMVANARKIRRDCA